MVPAPVPAFAHQLQPGSGFLSYFSAYTINAPVLEIAAHGVAYPIQPQAGSTACRQKRTNKKLAYNEFPLVQRCCKKYNKKQLREVATAPPAS
jgi:hypothetical protein